MANTHVVVSGDTLGKIAATYKVSLEDLVTWNGIKDPNSISIGQEIRLTDPAAKPTHVVVSGDTLAKIAAAHKVTVDDLVRWNGIKDPNKLSVGQVLLLSGPSAEQVYVVKAGDTVSELALKFKLRWVDIAAVNKLENMDLIYVGQKLIIPAEGVARGPVPPAAG